MQRTLFRKSRNGIKDIFWHLRYKCDWMPKSKEVNLNVSDRQTAEKKRNDIINEAEKEHHGLIAPRAIREASKIEIKYHLKDFLSDNKTLGCSSYHIIHLNNYVNRLCLDCNWKYLGDIKADDFVKWRSVQSFSSKTLNHYLSGIKTFIIWLIRMNRIENNPLNFVRPIDRRRENKTFRRAFTENEIIKLLEVSSDTHRAIYLLALYVGMRWNEIRQLEWQDISFGEKPTVRMRASTTKNSKDAISELKDDVVKSLEKIKPEYAEGNIFLVFPRFRTMKKDWMAAGIPVIDKNGKRADFHSLRKTFCTMMFTSGIPQRIAQEAMRHSEARLTNQVYTDSSQLNTGAAIDMLPSISEITQKGKCPLIRPLNLVKNGHFLSFPVTNNENNSILQLIVNEANSHNLSLSVMDIKMVEAGGVEPPS